MKLTENRNKNKCFYPPRAKNCITAVSTKVPPEYYFFLSFHSHILFSTHTPAHKSPTSFNFDLPVYPPISTQAMDSPMCITVSKSVARLHEVCHLRGMCLFECIRQELEISRDEALELFCRYIYFLKH